MGKNFEQLVAVFPVAMSLLAGVLCVLITHLRARQLIGGLFCLGHIALSCWLVWKTAMGDEPVVLVSQMGAWPAPLGISVVVDPLSALVLLASGLVVFSVLVFCSCEYSAERQGAFFHPMVHFLACGVYWSVTTGDLFNLFVAFEVMLMSSYVLLVLGTTTLQMRQAHKYILLNLVGSMLFVMLCGLVYGATGTLNMADLTKLMMEGEMPTSAGPILCCLLIVFGLKAAMFPLWFWLPETYPTMTGPVAGLLGGLLTKVGVYVVLRVFVMMLGESGAGGGSPDVAGTVAYVLAACAMVTMLVGVLGAVSRHTVRSILSVHVISQVGYMMMGVSVALMRDVPQDVKLMVVAGTVLFLLHNMIVKSALFLCGGLMHKIAGSDDLDVIGGVGRASVGVGVLFFVAAISLAGLPPSSGFFGKLVLIREAFAGAGAWGVALAAVAVVTGLFTLLSMVKIWSYGFWGPAAGKHADTVHGNKGRVVLPSRGAMLATGLLVCVAVSMGLGANVWYGLTGRASDVVLERKGYVDAVLGGSGLKVVETDAAERPLAGMQGRAEQ